MNEQLLINPSENGCLKDGFATPTKITIAKGDGIGPEIMDATLEIIADAGAKLAIEEIETYTSRAIHQELPRKRGIQSDRVRSS